MSNKRASPELDAARKRLALLNDAIPEAKYAVKAMTRLDRMCTRAWTAIRRPDDICLSAVQARNHWVEKASQSANLALARSHDAVCILHIERNKCEAAIADALLAHMLDVASSDDDDSSDDSSDNRPLRSGDAPVANKDDDEDDDSSSSSDKEEDDIVAREDKFIKDTNNNKGARLWVARLRVGRGVATNAEKALVAEANAAKKSK